VLRKEKRAMQKVVAKPERKEETSPAIAASFQKEREKRRISLGKRLLPPSTIPRLLHRRRGKENCCFYLRRSSFLLQIPGRGRGKDYDSHSPFLRKRATCFFAERKKKPTTRRKGSHH